MKGNNQFYFCQATMIEAVQMYLNNQFREDQAPKVTKVDWERDQGQANGFRISVTDKSEIEPNDTNGQSRVKINTMV